MSVHNNSQETKRVFICG